MATDISLQQSGRVNFRWKMTPDFCFRNVFLLVFICMKFMQSLHWILIIFGNIHFEIWHEFCCWIASGFPCEFLCGFSSEFLCVCFMAIKNHKKIHTEIHTKTHWQSSSKPAQSCQVVVCTDDYDASLATETTTMSLLETTISTFPYVFCLSLFFFHTIGLLGGRSEH